MSIYLLDTCVAVWASQSPKNLSAKSRDALNDLDSVCYISTLTAWEIAIKGRNGDLRIEVQIDSWFSSLLDNLSAVELTLSAAACAKLCKLPELHRDPFDRMLICQAIVEGATIITPDSHIHEYPVNVLW